MGRPRKIRNIENPPFFNRLKPAGIPARYLEQVELSLDEYESIRLADLLLMTHEEAAAKMNVSRPTFTRLIEGARRKIAETIVEGKELIIAGGDYQFLHERYLCKRCNEKYNGANINSGNCPTCGDDMVYLNGLYRKKGCNRHRGGRR